MQKHCIGAAAGIFAALFVTTASASYYGLTGNFETEGMMSTFSNTYCYFNGSSAGVPACSGNSPWTGQLGASGGGAGMIISGSSAWGGFLAPPGENYYGFVQIGGVLTNTFTSTATGDFRLSWLDTNRAAGCSGPCAAETYDVSISHGHTVVDLGVFTPATFATWEQEISHKVFQLLANTSYTISFTGLGSYPPDSTAFIDDLELRKVPEPASLAVLGMGLLGLGLFRRRSRKKAV